MNIKNNQQVNKTIVLGRAAGKNIRRGMNG